MDDLTYELRQLCLRNRDGSHSTQANRLRILKQVAGELRELGYRNMRGKSIAGRHVDALLGHWRAKGLSVGTIKNRLCALRWWTEEVGKEGVVPSDNARLGIPERRHVTNENKAQELGGSSRISWAGPTTTCRRSKPASAMWTCWTSSKSPRRPGYRRTS